MLNSKQYQAVGRIALGFNRIDFVVHCYTIHFLGTSELGIAEMIAGRYRLFGQKRDFLKLILQQIAVERPAVKRSANAALSALAEASAIASERNGFIHGMVQEDPRTKRMVIGNKGRLHVCDQETLDALVSKVDEVFGKLTNSFSTLFVKLAEIREAQRSI
jgi:hypothetical protein